MSLTEVKRTYGRTVSHLHLLSVLPSVVILNCQDCLMISADRISFDRNLPAYILLIPQVILHIFWPAVCLG